ncbi:MAG: S16 family serine protease [Vulcanimicrobiaceae bacterium]
MSASTPDLSKSPPKRAPRGPLALALLLSCLALALVPTPYALLAPGDAVDLSQHVTVADRRPPPIRLYLTDVEVLRASTLLLLGGLIPGVRVVPNREVAPPGISTHAYDVMLAGDMQASQQVGAIVAERAAGYRVADPPLRSVVLSVLSGSPSEGVLQAGDAIVAVDGAPVTGAASIDAILRHAPRPAGARLEIVRGGRRRTVAITPERTDGRVRLGVLVVSTIGRADLPVPVRVRLTNVIGPSGGLMFALTVYATLAQDRPPWPSAVAGTGTIALDGRVGAIGGAPEKLLAAERAGAKIFLVPEANYRSVAGTGTIPIVPVATFAQALGALRRAAGS